MPLRRRRGDGGEEEMRLMGEREVQRKGVFDFRQEVEEVERRKNILSYFFLLVPRNSYSHISEKRFTCQRRGGDIILRVAAALASARERDN